MFATEWYKGFYIRLFKNLMQTYCCLEIEYYLEGSLSD